MNEIRLVCQRNLVDNMCICINIRKQQNLKTLLTVCITPRGSERRSVYCCGEVTSIRQYVATVTFIQ